MGGAHLDGREAHLGGHEAHLNGREAHLDVRGAHLNVKGQAVTGLTVDRFHGAGNGWEYWGR